MYAWQKEQKFLTPIKYPYLPQLIDAQCHLESAALGTNDALCPTLGSISSELRPKDSPWLGFALTVSHLS